MRRFNLWIGLGVVGLLIFVALPAPWLAPYDPVESADLRNAGLPPGRDILSRVLYGARVSLTVGLLVQVMNTCVGVTLGLTAAYFGGCWDELVQGLTNLMLAIPRGGADRLRSVVMPQGSDVAHHPATDPGRGR